MARIKVRVNKFYTFTASCLIQAVGAPVYTFSIYGPALGAAMGLSQAEVEGVASMLAFGNFLAIISGTAYDRVEHHNRMGPRLTVWVGSLLAFVGYSGLYLIASGQVQATYGALLALAAISGNASSWFDTATIVTNVRNFPNRRGAVVGLLKSFVGLSGSMYSSVYTSFLAPDAASYLALLAAAVPLGPLLLSLAVNHVPYVEQAEVQSLGGWANPESRFLLAFVIVAALAIYQMTSALLQGMGDLPLPGGSGLDLLDLNTVGMFGLLAAMLLVPWRSGGFVSRYVHEHLADPEEPSTVHKWVSQLRGPSADFESGGGGDEQHPRRGADTAGGALAGRRADSAPAGGGGLAALAAPGAQDRGVSSRPPHPRGPGAAAPPAALKAAQQGAAEVAAAPVDAPDALREPLLPPQGPAQCRDAAPPRPRLSVGSIAPSVECHHHFPSLSLGQAARTPQFWLLFVMFIAGVGTCLTFLNNLAPINLALGGQPGGQVAFVSVFAVGNAAGRLLMGLVPEHLLHASGTPRTAWLVGVFCTLCAAALGAASASAPRHLWPLSLLLGGCYGSVFTLIPAVAADLFGLRHFAANYSSLQTACAIAGYVFPLKLTSFFYSRAAAAHGGAEPCIGADCYSPTFAIEAACCLLAAACAAAVTRSTVNVYALMAKHLEEVEEEQHHDMLEQWTAEHHLLYITRAPSDPVISSTTGAAAACGHGSPFRAHAAAAPHALPASAAWGRSAQPGAVVGSAPAEGWTVQQQQQQQQRGGGGGR